MITGKNEAEILTKDISCECKCKFGRHGRKCDSNRKWNNCEIGKYLASIIDDSVIVCDEL